MLALSTGKLLLSAGAHCVETDRDDASLTRAIDTLVEMSGHDRTRIMVAVVRETMSDA